MSKGPPRKKQKREEIRNGGQKDGDPAVLPQKKFFRQRAHANPFADNSFEYPSCPEEADWESIFPILAAREDDPERARDEQAQISLRPEVKVADIGCGFGGLLFGLAPIFPDTLIVGMEIRTSVTEFVQGKIKAMRAQAQQQLQDKPPSGSTHYADRTPTYQNIGCVRANTMKFLPNYFRRAQLRALFFCFPDPHFKARKHKQRIVSSTLASEYAYVLEPGGMVYTITDVEDLHLWMVRHFEEHDSFERVEEDQMVDEDERKCVEVMKTETEEGKKVERNGGMKLFACFRRLQNPPWPGE